MVRADNRVREGIRRCEPLAFREGQLSFDPGLRTSTSREFSLYRWEDGGSERPVKEQDHAMDDLRYFVSTVLANEEEKLRRGFCGQIVKHEASLNAQRLGN